MSDPYNGRCVELSAFLTAIIVVCAYGLPIVMAHAPQGKIDGYSISPF